MRVLAGGLKGATVQVNRKLERVLNDLGGVRTPEMRKAGNTLARSIRKTLNTGGGGMAVNLKSRKEHFVSGPPSQPGQPPHRQTGALAKSVKAAPSGDVIKVGPLHFTSLFLEEGVNAVKGQRHLRRGRRGRLRSGNVTKRTLRIAARPFMQRALAAVQSKMVDVFVTEGRKHLERA